MKTKKSTSKQSMWDLLIPVMLTIVVLPLAVRLAIYSCGFSGYEWYVSDDILSDFYCYYKSYLLDIIGILSAIILLFRMTLYREKTKDLRIFIPLAVYSICVLLSAICSVNTDASLKGNFESFESVIVLIVYVIMALYTFQIMESDRDYKFIWYSILAISVIFVIIGVFQIIGHDLMNFEWIQRLLMTKEQFSVYGGEIQDTFTGNNVYLTLYNPNYAGVTLCMLFAIIWFMVLSESQKKIRIAYFIASAAMLILIWFTYSRASLLTAFFVMILGILQNVRKMTKKQIFLGAGAFAALLAVLVCMDACLDFKYLSRMIDKNTREPLTSMTSDENGIHICYDGTNYNLYFEQNALICTTDASKSSVAVTETPGSDISLPFGKDSYATFYDNEIYLQIADNLLVFIKEDSGYLYETPSGMLSPMNSVEAVDLHGLEYLGSARGYIWSRTLPLLDDYFFIGSGPDTFAEVFPQEDYAGKLVYSDQPDMVIEKAHNDYLTKWVQTGGISALCLIIFYILFIRSGWRRFFRRKAEQERPSDTLQNRLGTACYVACLSYMLTGLFNDSTLQTAPFFWVFAGIALSSIYVKNNGLS